MAREWKAWRVASRRLTVPRSASSGLERLDLARRGRPRRSFPACSRPPRPARREGSAAAPPRPGGRPAWRPREARRSAGRAGPPARSASSSRSTPATQAATYSPSEWPSSARGRTPQLIHSRASAYSVTKTAGWAKRVSSSGDPASSAPSRSRGVPAAAQQPAQVPSARRTPRPPPPSAARGRRRAPRAGRSPARGAAARSTRPRPRGRRARRRTGRGPCPRGASPGRGRERRRARSVRGTADDGPGRPPRAAGPRPPPRRAQTTARRCVQLAPPRLQRVRGVGQRRRVAPPGARARFSAAVGQRGGRAGGEDEQLPGARRAGGRARGRLFQHHVRVGAADAERAHARAARACRCAPTARSAVLTDTRPPEAVDLRVRHGAVERRRDLARARSASTVLMSPATPAAASRCPTLVLTEPMARLRVPRVPATAAWLMALSSMASPSGVPRAVRLHVLHRCAASTPATA